MYKLLHVVQAAAYNVLGKILSKKLVTQEVPAPVGFNHVSSLETNMNGKSNVYTKTLLIIMFVVWYLDTNLV